LFRYARREEEGHVAQRQKATGIKGSPACNLSAPVTRDYERARYDYYERSVYWK
jgi:hypothetical protein